MTEPYWTDGQVTLYHGDCREVLEWLSADVLVTDPPYGIAYSRGRGTWKKPVNRPNAYVMPSDRATKIDGDLDTRMREWALGAWGERPAVMFGSLKLGPPSGLAQVLIYRKPTNAGTHATAAGFRHDIEAIYLAGKWPRGFGGRSSVVDTGARSQGNDYSCSARYGHPHAKPVDVMETLITACPSGVIADPFAGSGSTLVAARNQGRAVIGVEIDERYCELAARRLSQGTLAVTP
jgi:DNA modification methylase